MIYDNSLIYNSPIGEIILLETDNRLSGLYFKDCADNMIINNKRSRLLEKTIEWLDCYFAGKKPDFEVELMMHGTVFQQKVWEYVKQIPYGKTCSYGDIAKKIAKEKGLTKMSSQAIGTAVGNNPVSIIVPCHRVIKADGRLGQYGGNEYRKMFLLELEGYIKRSE